MVNFAVEEVIRTNRLSLYFIPADNNLLHWFSGSQVVTYISGELAENAI